jgi:hypothetical protein
MTKVLAVAIASIYGSLSPNRSRVQGVVAVSSLSHRKFCVLIEHVIFPKYLKSTVMVPPF